MLKIPHRSQHLWFDKERDGGGDGISKARRCQKQNTCAEHKITRHHPEKQADGRVQVDDLDESLRAQDFPIEKTED